MRDNNGRAARLQREEVRYADDIRDLTRRLEDANADLKRKKKVIRTSSTLLVASAGAIFFGAWGLMREPLLAVGVPTAILSLIALIVILTYPDGRPIPEDEVVRLNRKLEDRTIEHDRKMNRIYEETIVGT